MFKGQKEILYPFQKHPPLEPQLNFGCILNTISKSSMLLEKIRLIKIIMNMIQTAMHRCRILGMQYVYNGILPFYLNTLNTYSEGEIH